MIKYRIDFPIRKDCGLKCFYCFHVDYFEKNHPYDKEDYDRGFTLDEWAAWRDKFLRSPNEILLNIHGGETFDPVRNSKLLREIMEHDVNRIQTYDFLSNGLVDTNTYYETLNGFEKQVKRIGFTFHREMIAEKPKLVKRFEDNVLFVKEELGIPVYVKELLRVKDREKIIKNRDYWKLKGIDFKIQDYKGDFKGATFTEYSKYSGLDHALIDEEYKHPKNIFCTCMKGYRTFGIRGYEPFGGDVVSCWQDPVIVGNIQEGWFNNNFKVDRYPGTSVRNVIGVPKKYAGTFDGGRESHESILKQMENRREACKH